MIKQGLDGELALSAGFYDRLLLGHGRAARSNVPAWLKLSYLQFHQRVTAPAYPCYFGAAAEKRGELYYTLVTATTIDLMPATLEAFLLSAEKSPTERRNLTIFFEPDTLPLAHDKYRQRFWRFLRFLGSRDPSPWPDTVPVSTDDPSWEFSFAGRPIFVFCSAPSYQRRVSRNLGPGMIILMQPRSSFFGIDGHTLAGVAARRRTRQLLEAWDRMSTHPDLGVFGEQENREWKQYFLPDNNRLTRGQCPFHKTGETSG